MTAGQCERHGFAWVAFPRALCMARVDGHTASFPAGEPFCMACRVSAAEAARRMGRDEG